MATGLIAVLGSSSTATYTAAANAKLRILAFFAQAGAPFNITINGVSHSCTNGTAGGFVVPIDIYVAAGASITVGTMAGATAIISCIEEV